MFAKRKSILTHAIPLAFMAMAVGLALYFRNNGPGVSRESLPAIPVRLNSANRAKDNSIMFLIPAGPFPMGSRDGTGSVDEHPVHNVTLAAYYMDRYETTNSQFAGFLNETARTPVESPGKLFLQHDWGIKKEGGRWIPSPGYEKYPVINVSWFGADGYCRWAGKRLPTEAEWEKAARADSDKKFCFGNDDRFLKDFAYYGSNSGFKTHAVGEKRPNRWGLYDMHGNVREWVKDWYGENYYKNSPEENPDGPYSGSAKVIRGGSWMDDPDFLRSASRDWEAPSFLIGNLGFRCAADYKK